MLHRVLKALVVVAAFLVLVGLPIMALAAPATVSPPQLAAEVTPSAPELYESMCATYIDRGLEPTTDVGLTALAGGGHDDAGLVSTPEPTPGYPLRE